MQCPDGFVGGVEYGKCYWFSEEPNSWLTGLLECNKMNASMVSVDSRKEHNAIFHYVENRTGLLL